MTYLAIDPGKATGWCKFDDEGEIVWMGTVDFDNIYEWLKSFEVDPPKIIVIEEYRLNKGPQFKHIEHSNSKIETVQVIGMVKQWAKTVGAEVIEQARDKRIVGYKYWGEKSLPKSNRLNHAYDATAHGIYYLQRNKIREAKV